MLKLIILFVFVISALGGNDYNNHFPWWHTDDNTEDGAKSTSQSVPFPQCLISGSKSKLLYSSSWDKLVEKAIGDEEGYAKKEYYENYKKDNHDTVDDYDYNSRKNKGKSIAAAAAAIKLAGNLMSKLACDLNGTNSDNIQSFLDKFNLPSDFCEYNDKVDCDGKVDFRLPNGLCNNLDRPYDGNSHTAFDRLVAADYTDYISEPRRKSVRGGLLPACRKISLALGSKPVFDRSFNNLFASFGQFVGHDIALSLPVSDSYNTPITSCTCESKYDWNKCTVIDIQPDDPYLRGQKCMAFPATAQAFRNEICSLGVKQQMNGNTHFIDLSNLYGNSIRIAQALRADDGLLKSTRRFGTDHELPPAQREGLSCTDSTPKRKCFAGGDSRVMINLLFTGIQTMFLRAHNTIAKTVKTKLQPDWSSDEIYENTRKIVTAYFQKVFYEDWLTILLGKDVHDKEFPILDVTDNTQYLKDVKPVVFNEVATGAFRLHTLCRDLFSRCTTSGKRIDELWLNDILHKSKYAYDIENNGLDSLICGSLYDYGFAYDGNFAHQIHNRLFETTNSYGHLWRNDLIAINICRGREHGIPSYVKFREYCNLGKAEYFEDLGNTINYSGIKLLKKLYKDVSDVDLFVGLNLEDPVKGGLLGPVSSCLLIEQFKRLRDGDRFFYTHTDQLTLDQRKFIRDLPLSCFVCLTSTIDEVPKNAFVPPTDENDLIDCSLCTQFDPATLGPVFGVTV